MATKFVLLKSQLSECPPNNTVPLYSVYTLVPSPPQPYPLQPQTRLQWRRCADLPVGMCGAQSAQVGGKVCIGAGATNSRDNADLVFQYDPERDGWATLPPCPVSLFALGQFQGHIITVGGILRGGSDRTNKLHRYKEESQEWEEFLLPMPTSRRSLSVITTQSAIIACGGIVSTGKKCATVEVYTVETGQWHAADPLPIPCSSMTSVTIADTCYLLGGYDNTGNPARCVLGAPISSLIEKATSPPRGLASIFNRSLWKTLQDTPLTLSAAACLSCLLAVGGHDDRIQHSPAVHMFQPQTNSWARMTSGDLPVAVNRATAVQLPDNKLLVCGGWTTKEGCTENVYMASITNS